MKDWYVRPVFFAEDVAKSIAFYTETLGFKLDWNHDEDGKPYVCQVSRLKFELIVERKAERAGAGRVFISLWPEQEKELRKEIEERGIEAEYTEWGMSIIKILDPDRNELFFSLP